MPLMILLIVGVVFVFIMYIMSVVGFWSCFLRDVNIAPNEVDIGRSLVYSVKRGVADE
jgi:hypothetical protein